MPEGARSSRGPVDGPGLEGERIGPRRVDGKLPGDAATAPWFDAAVTCWGKAVAYAEETGLDLSLFGKMRAGAKPVYLRHLLPMLGHTEAVLAFVGPLLESFGHVARPVNAPTFVQLAGAVLADLDDGSSITRALIERAAEKRGWSPEQVAMALHREDDEP
jgi:hypothetical protein